MGLEPQFTRQDIRDYIKRRMVGFRMAIESRFKRTGEEFVKLARESGNYTDRTGNLRSSIGYILLYNGKILASNFQKVAGGTEGANTAASYARKVAAEFNTGYVLIGVAGMDYAAAVEAKGKDVITGTSQIVEITLRNAINRIAA